MTQEKRYIKDMSQYEYLEGWEKLAIGQQLQRWAKKNTGRIAILDSEREITYDELNQEARSLAGAFLNIGIQTGDKVVVQLPNRISFVVVLFALSYIGAVPIMALPAHRKAELEGIIKLAEPTAYIVADKFLGYEYLSMANMLKEEYPFLKAVIVDGERGGDFLLSELKEMVMEFPEVDSYSTAVLLLSGGTTGIPKLIPRTHTDYIYNARMSVKRCQLNRNSVYLASLPIAHNFPLCCPGLLGILDVGGKVILARNTCADEILSLITEKKVTITALVPAMVTVCMEMMEYTDEYDLYSLKVLQVGGAMLEDSLADKIITKWPCKLMQVYGTAEGLLCFTRVNDQDEIIARCQGTPVSLADDIKIVNENDEKVSDGEYGELLCRGPYTIDEYYNASEVNGKSFTADGYYRTGDRAMQTKEGNIRMGGRIKEQINRAGEKIMPAEIEAYLCRHVNIQEASVVGVPDEVLGNRSCTFILTKNGENMSLNEIHQFLKAEGVAQYKFPDQLEILDNWPLTNIGKIDKKALVKIATRQELEMQKR